jgi:ankyrin repeat protein
MKKNVLYCLSLLIIGCSSAQQTDNKISNNYLATDFRLFENTPIWELAKAVKNEDTLLIRNLVLDSKMNINYQEPKFGNTLLMLSIENQLFNSSKILFELGAKPNIYDYYNGTSAIIYAAGINGTDDDTKFLKLVLKYGANPNDIEIGGRNDSKTGNSTPLEIACSNVNQLVSSIEKVKILVEAGANIHYVQDTILKVPLALRTSLIMENLDVTLFLLESGIDYTRPILNREGELIYICDFLRELYYPLGSKKHLQKMQIVQFLATKGLDYSKTPIPDYIRKDARKDYPKKWKEYLERY